MVRYTLDSVRSCVWVSARSSLHPINTETRGITGWFEAAIRADGSLDLDQRVSGELQLAVDRLTSGNVSTTASSDGALTRGATRRSTGGWCGWKPAASIPTT